MRFASIVLLALLAAVSTIRAQSIMQEMVDAERSLSSAVAAGTERDGFLSYLADDGMLFKPDPVNGKDYWKLYKDDGKFRLKRSMTHADISSNGLLGYTTGVWEKDPVKKDVGERSVGQYVTIWSKKPDGEWKIALDITTSYDEAAPPEDNPVLPANFVRDLNTRRWSAADPSMNFFKKGMSRSGLGGAFDDNAALDVRLLIEENPPILGKNNAVKAMKRYVAVSYPKKVSLLEAADLAYVWNPCDYANSEEGMERGTCLNVWKLRNKKWYITLAVYARVVNVVKPEIKMSPKNRDQSGSLRRNNN